MEKGLVSVLLTSYNRPQMVKKAIESVLNQTYQNFELIILDDNSNEETLKVIFEYLKDPRVIFFKSNVKDEDRYKESPYARQVNVGLKLAKGEFITYLCDDDYYLPQRLEKMVKFFEENPDKYVCFGRQMLIDESGNVIGERISDEILEHPEFRVDHSSVMHRRECFEKCGFWDTQDLRAADAWYWKKLAENGFLFYPIMEVLDVHCFHSGSISSKIDRGEIKWKKKREI